MSSVFCHAKLAILSYLCIRYGKSSETTGGTDRHLRVEHDSRPHHKFPFRADIHAVADSGELRGRYRIYGIYRCASGCSGAGTGNWLFPFCQQGRGGPPPPIWAQDCSLPSPQQSQLWPQALVGLSSSAIQSLQQLRHPLGLGPHRIGAISGKRGSPLQNKEEYSGTAEMNKSLLPRYGGGWGWGQQWRSLPRSPGARLVLSAGPRPESLFILSIRVWF